MWSSDGATVYYASRHDGRFELWQGDSRAATPPARLDVGLVDRPHLFPTSAAAGSVVFTGAGHGAGIWIALAHGGTSTVLVDNAFDETAGALSPDGTLLAYQSDESGRWEIYLMRIADKRRAAISAGGGTAPFWSRDGATLFYMSVANVMRASVTGTGDAGAPSAAASVQRARAVGVGPDGIVRLVQDGSPLPLHAVLTLEWWRELRQLLGPAGTVLIR